MELAGVPVVVTLILAAVLMGEVTGGFLTEPPMGGLIDGLTGTLIGGLTVFVAGLVAGFREGRTCFKQVGGVGLVG